MMLLARIILTSLTIIMLFLAAACQNGSSTASNPALPSPSVSVVPLETPMVEPSLTPRRADYSLLTLPVIDAFLTDEAFVAAAQKQLSLTNEQVKKLRTQARQETAKLRESETDTYTFSTSEAHAQAMQTLQEIIGEAKTQEFAKFIFAQWGRDTASDSPAPSTSASPTPSPTLPPEANNIPTDTRVVVNAPAYRMDVFKNGQLIKTYKVGIGYPEFPLPVALRKASSIIFNPTWTPPDEPWVESPSSKVKVGETVPAGSALNPLGPIKIPIGLPSLIHGGKTPAKIGTFASHGCVGLTDAQVQDFAKLLADVSGAQLTVEQMAQYAKNRTVTQNVKLPQPIPVELRYETIVVENGKLHIYRDVYDRNTNTEAELERVLQTHGVRLADLTVAEREQVQEALSLMARDATGKTDNSAASPSPTAKSKQTGQRKLTRTVKGAKEMIIEIAALQGKGYPAPVDLSAGTPVKATPPKRAKKK
jgi:lipoprotein-anchoring transpeptidase ErfK/SrfK